VEYGTLEAERRAASSDLTQPTAISRLRSGRRTKKKSGRYRI
jgi:hypothetical protein